MKVGEYIRTNDGCICKILKYTDISDTDFYVNTDSLYDVIYKSWIKKSSPNIIDLIEVGDYVNGMEVTRISGTRLDDNDLHCYCERNGNENWKQVMIPAKDIKSIVTKEQFLQMEYRIGE